MKTLIVLRHARSTWRDPTAPDHDRPLDGRGRAEAPRMATLLREQGLVPDRIMCSTARRTRETAELVVGSGAFECEIEFLDLMYGADAEDLLQVVHSAPDDARCVLLVGHNPGVEKFVEGLTDVTTIMPTAAVAHIQVDVAEWTEITFTGAATLAATWRP